MPQLKYLDFQDPLEKKKLREVVKEIRDEKAAKQRGFFRNGVYYGYGKEISQSGVQVFGKIQTCHFARQRESAGLFAVQSV